MKKIYLFRHGETNWNSDTTLKYSKEAHNTNLNEIGIEQAKKNAEFLKDKGIQHIYTSHLKRAYETAEILAKTLSKNINIKLDIIENLQEFSTYDDTVIGMTKKEIKEKIGLENHNKRKLEKDGLLDWRPLKCETKREARQRITNAVQKICETSEFDTIAIASHGSILKELLRNYNFEDDSGLKNCEVIEANFDKKNLKIIKRIKI